MPRPALQLLPRIYAVALITLATAFLLGGCTYHRHQLNLQAHQMRTQMLPGWKSAVQVQLTSIREVIEATDERLEDDSRSKFRPIQPVVSTLEERAHRIVALGEMQQPPGLVSAKLTQLAGVSSEVYSDLLEVHGELFGLRTSEIATRQKRAQRDLDDLLLTIQSRKDYPALVSLGNIQLALAFQRELIVDIVSLSGGKQLICFERYFPVVSSPKVYFHKHEQNSIQLMVGSYSTASVDNTKVIVNGDTLSLGADGKVMYKVPTAHRGQHTLVTKAVVTNPLTGEVTSGEGSFTYEVH